MECANGKVKRLFLFSNVSCLDKIISCYMFILQMLGALDGKHIRVQKPWNSGSFFYNYKQFFSVVLMAVVDADYR